MRDTVAMETPACAATVASDTGPTPLLFIAIAKTPCSFLFGSRLRNVAIPAIHRNGCNRIDAAHCRRDGWQSVGVQQAEMTSKKLSIKKF
jgi:hypothetical protein